MLGKVVTLVSNDIYGNNDNREVCVFACFNHKKYMNNYCIFCYKDELDKNIMYYGSLHTKGETLISFFVKEPNFQKNVESFIQGLVNGTIDNNEYEIINIQDKKKIELVSFNQVECKNLEMLKERTIKEEIVSPIIEEPVEKNYLPLYILLLLFILGIDFLYIYNKQPKQYTYLECTKKINNSELSLKGNTDWVITFNRKNTLDKVIVTETYQFEDYPSYNKFKNDKDPKDYFKDEEYKNAKIEYDDASLTLNISYLKEVIFNDKKEASDYLKKGDYTCEERKYYK